MRRFSWLRATSRRAHRGQTLVFFALATTVLMGSLGLALDVGYNYGQRRTMQNAADAAALAGARAISIKSTDIYTAVKTVAQQNGLQDENLLECRYIDNSFETTGLTLGLACKDLPNPQLLTALNISGVQVRVREEHPTFVMSVLGIPTSGTAATATAQVQVLAKLDNGLAPFLPCGIDTVTVGNNNQPNGTHSIFATQGQYDYPSPTLDYTATVEAPAIQDSAYSYIWTGSVNTLVPRTTLDDGTPAPNPRFLIHSPPGSNAPSAIARCTVTDAGWKGVNQLSGSVTLGGSTIPLPDGLDSNPPSYGMGTSTGPGAITSADTGSRTGPASDIPGPGGCKAGVSENCVMILPIVDNAASTGSGSNLTLAARTFGAFLVTSNNPGNSGQSNEHYGRLIKGYPFDGNGQPLWNPTYTGPVVIRLIR